VTFSPKAVTKGKAWGQFIPLNIIDDDCGGFKLQMHHVAPERRSFAASDIRGISWVDD